MECISNTSYRLFVEKYNCDCITTLLCFENYEKKNKMILLPTQ